MSFSLTCVSSGGPVTFATWTLNGEEVQSRVDSADFVAIKVNVDQQSSSYSIQLKITGQHMGTYQCSVANNEGTSPKEPSLNVQGNNMVMY